MDRLDAREITVYSVLAEKGRNFNIPVFQRPYSWDAEYCQKLWEDIKDFFINDSPQKKMNDDSCRYFLGPVVIYKNSNGKMEIIDGQQRITTLLLLLKNFYDKIGAKTDRNDPADTRHKNASDVLKNIEECLWQWKYSDEKEADCFDPEKPILSSEVMDDNTYEVFKRLMTSSKNIEITKKSTAYEKNYKLFSELIDNEFGQMGELAKVHMDQFVGVILKKCSVLFIDCSDQAAALKIFDTLNNRGMQLRDADIFKAQMFQPLNRPEQKQEFRENWEIFSQLATGFTLAKQTNQYDPLTDVFRQLMGVRRAEKDISSNEVALRTFFEDRNGGKDLVSFEVLKSKLIPLAAFWCKISQLCTLPEEYQDIKADAQAELDKISELFNTESQKYLQVLSCISKNAYWRYLLSVFYIKKVEEIRCAENLASIAADLCALLKKATAFSIYSLVTGKPDAYKKKVYKQACSLWRHEQLSLGEESLSQKDFDTRLDARECSSELNRAIILLHAYLNKQQKDLIMPGAQIEHIFPRSWAKDMSGAQRVEGVYGFTDQDMQEQLHETFGNKVMLEAVVNNAARDKYFDFKSAIYHGLIPPTFKGTIARKEDGTFAKIELKSVDKAKCRPGSLIADIHDIWDEPVWGKAQIEEREKAFHARIWAFLKENYSA